jgi:hypothetical protein
MATSANEGKRVTNNCELSSHACGRQNSTLCLASSGLAAPAATASGKPKKNATKSYTVHSCVVVQARQLLRIHVYGIGAALSRMQRVIANDLSPRIATSQSLPLGSRCPFGGLVHLSRSLPAARGAVGRSQHAHAELLRVLLVQPQPHKRAAVRQRHAHLHAQRKSTHQRTPGATGRSGPI